MKVMKFGGTSVGRPERMKDVAKIITREDERKIVVLSALSGTTNELVKISEALQASKRDEAGELIDKLEKYYGEFINDLYSSEDFVAKATKIVKEHFEFLHIILKISYSEALNKDILAQGELMSTKLFSLYLTEQGIDNILLSALDFMTIDAKEEPQIGGIQVRLKKLIEQHPDTQIFITQGFICKNSRGEIDNLKRGGSDYTATLVAAAIEANICEIWTDIDGMHNNDPRLVEGTTPVRKLSFEEAAELAYFGAKILHPASIWPAQHFNFPVKLCDTMEPDALGTIISSEAESEGVKAIAAKDNITAIKIKSSRMLLAYGFLRKVFEIFEKYATSIDMVTTSEVAVSLTIDNDSQLDKICKELEMYGNIHIDKGQSIICIAGNNISSTQDVLMQIFDSLSGIPVRMVSFGGSSHNVSILVPADFKNTALKKLHQGLFA